MITTAEVLKVQEIKNDFIIDGLIQKYDDSAHHKIGKVVGGNERLLEILRKYVPYGDIYVTYNNFNKSSYFDLCTIVEMKYIIDVMTEDEYLETFKPIKD